MVDAQHRVTDGREPGTLYVVATPIGNLGDITLRALEVLKSVAVVAAEDTRHTRHLIDHYGIAAKLMAVHEHNEAGMVGQIVDLLRQGSSVALVSDAGTPAISDPGARLVRGVREAACPVVSVPGPNAAIAALSVSGLAAPHFVFYGFLPARRGERTKALAALAPVEHALVFYEAPHRVLECVADLCDVLGGGREIVIARELTKRFEQVHACALSEAAGWLSSSAEHVKGEFVLIVSGSPAAHASDASAATNVLEILLEELPVKQAVGLAVRLTGARRNELYAMALNIKQE